MFILEFGSKLSSRIVGSGKYLKTFLSVIDESSLDEINDINLFSTLVFSIVPENADVTELSLLVILLSWLNAFFGKLKIAACLMGLSELAEVTGIAYFLSINTFAWFILTPILSKSS